VIYIESLDANNVLSIVHSTQFLGKLDELPQMK